MSDQLSRTSVSTRVILQQLSVLFLAFTVTTESPGASLTPSASPLPAALSVSNYLERVLSHNQSLQIRLLEFEVSRRRFHGERGIYEPDFVASYERQENQRRNSKEQLQSQRVGLYEDQNNIYNAGLEALIPSGARVRMGYTLRDLNNNLSSQILGSSLGLTREYQTFAGLSLTQPLLKGAWKSVTEANIRLAALGSDVAFQDYRKHLMTVISTAEAAYWNLYLAQEQMRFFRDSVALAETLASDAKTREKAGLGSELDTLQAEAGLALRRSKLNEARQRFHESLAQARNLAGVSGESTDSIELLDTPRAGTVSTTFQEAGAGALSRNPDYLSQVAKLAQEDIRIAYAKNQRLPQLDLKASYGLNGLGLTPGQSTDEALTGSFASWTAGAEMRVPVGGGKRSRNELQAARLRKQEALIGLQEVETQILNALESSIRKIASTESSANAYRKVVQFNEDLLKSQMTRVEVGKVESRKILEVEADLFESRNAVIEALVQHERARLELGFVEGALLGQRNLDLPQAYVQERTRLMIRQAAGSEERFKAIFEDLKKEYQRTQPPNNQSPAP